MGEAKRRGTFEQRKDQAAEREAQEWAVREGMKRQREQAEAERIRNLPPEERKEVILAGGNARAGRHSAMLAAVLALSLPSVMLVPGGGSKEESDGR